MLRIVSRSVSSTATNSEHVHDRHEGTDFQYNMPRYRLTAFLCRFRGFTRKKKIRNKHKMIGCFPLKSASTALRFWWWSLYHENKSREGRDYSIDQ